MAERGAGLGLTAGHVERTSALPTGTVTFLLTDIEGSTRLWEQSPDLMRAALIRHDAIIERLVAEHGGTLVRPRGEGDSRFAVFKAATDAVGAACAIQIELTHESWPLAEPLRVRMALHTTEADLRDSDYYGRGVNRCARLRALACGGQILVSGSTAMVVRDQPLAHVTLKNLGTRNLKDVVESEQIFQVRHSELPDSVDVILCHEGQIGDDVKQLVRQLTDRGLRPLLSSQLRQDGGGQDLEASLAASTSCAVLVGSRGLSDWEEGPLGVVLQSAHQDPTFHVFPVLLPGVRQPFDATTLPPPLDTRPWVDLREGIDHPEALASLSAAIRRHHIASEDPSGL